MKSTKQYRIKKDHDSIQAFINGELVGQMSVKKFCLMLLEERRKGRTDHAAEKPHEQSTCEKGAVGRNGCCYKDNHLP